MPRAWPGVSLLWHLRGVGTVGCGDEGRSGTHPWDGVCLGHISLSGLGQVLNLSESGLLQLLVRIKQWCEEEIKRTGGRPGPSEHSNNGCCYESLTGQEGVDF